MEFTDTFDLSIIVCTFKSSWEKLQITLDSLVNTEGCSFEIIVSDDGSETNHFDKLKEYFVEKHFLNYQLTALPENRGTVQNVYQGVCAARGKWIKLISPGDYMISSTILAEWIAFNSQNNLQWSFGLAEFYQLNQETKQKIKMMESQPTDLSPYHSGNIDRCRWNYLVLSDFAVGACTLCLRSVLTQYLLEIVGKVIYAEDNVYRLMMFDGVTFGYFQKSTIMYEYGSGISTSGNEIWLVRLKADIDAADAIIKKRNGNNDFQNRLLQSYDEWKCSSGLKKKYIFSIKNKGFRIVLKRKIQRLKRKLKG